MILSDLKIRGFFTLLHLESRSAQSAPHAQFPLGFSYPFQGEIFSCLGNQKLKLDYQSRENRQPHQDCTKRKIKTSLLYLLFRLGLGKKIAYGYANEAY